MNRAMANEWLKAVKDDLSLIERIIDNPSLTHLTAFHSQQAIEKVFKAIIEFYNRKVPKNHDLLLLKDLIAGDFNIDNEDLLETLNGLYIEARYPGNLGLLPNGKPSIKQAQEFFEYAKDIFNRANEIVNSK